MSFYSGFFSDKKCFLAPPLSLCARRWLWNNGDKFRIMGIPQMSYASICEMVRERSRAFVADRGGNVALLFALALPVVVGVAGAGVDLGRGSAMRSSLQQSVDATSQTLTDTVKTCHDRNRTNDVTIDQGCLNDPQFMATLRSEAQTLVVQNFKQRGYDQAPALTGPITVDQINGRMRLQASVGYNCVVFRVLNSDCNLNAVSGTSANLSTQALTLSLSGPTGQRFIYVGDPTVNLPVSYNVSGGWSPYSWGQTGMPGGLSLNPDGSTESAQISGTPTDPTVCNLPSPCDPLPLAPTGVSVTDAGDQNRGGLNKQQVQGVVNFVLIRQLRLQLSGVMNTVPSPTAGSYYADATRSGGTGNYIYSCTGVPAGMSCNTATGRVSGTPGYNQSGTLTVTVTDITDGRTASASISYHFLPPPIVLSFGTGYLTGTNATVGSTTVVATGGYGVLNVTCASLPPGYAHSGNPGNESNYGTISGRWQTPGGLEQNGTLTCTATDQAGQVKTANLNWAMEYIGNDECLTNSSIPCPGTWVGSWGTCRNGNGMWICFQWWTWGGGELSPDLVPPPGPDTDNSRDGEVCSTAGSAATAPVYGCYGTSNGCTITKGWNRQLGSKLRCAPRG
ncbi:Ig domain-containing protein [Bosea massiliensis]